MSSSFNGAEKIKPVVGDPASSTLTGAETLAEDEPQTFNAPISDIGKAKEKKKPGASWQNEEVLEIPHKLVPFKLSYTKILCWHLSKSNMKIVFPG